MGLWAYNDSGLGCTQMYVCAAKTHHHNQFSVCVKNQIFRVLFSSKKSLLGMCTMTNFINI